MPWPGRKRAGGTPDGETAGTGPPIEPAPRAWATLAAPARAIQALSLTADPGRFETRLAAWDQTGVTRQGVGHLRTAEAPSGQVHGIVRVLADAPVTGGSTPSNRSDPAIQPVSDPLPVARRELTVAPDPAPLPRTLPVAPAGPPPSEPSRPDRADGGLTGRVPSDATAGPAAPSPAPPASAGGPTSPPPASPPAPSPPAPAPSPALALATSPPAASPLPAPPSVPASPPPQSADAAAGARLGPEAGRPVATPGTSSGRPAPPEAGGPLAARSGADATRAGTPAPSVPTLQATPAAAPPIETVGPGPMARRGGLGAPMPSRPAPTSAPPGSSSASTDPGRRGDLPPAGPVRPATAPDPGPSGAAGAAGTTAPALSPGPGSLVESGSPAIAAATPAPGGDHAGARLVQREAGSDPLDPSADTGSVPLDLPLSRPSAGPGVGTVGRHAGEDPNGPGAVAGLPSAPGPAALPATGPASPADGPGTAGGPGDDGGPGREAGGTAVPTLGTAGRGLPVTGLADAGAGEAGDPDGTALDAGPDPSVPLPLVVARLSPSGVEDRVAPTLGAGDARPLGSSDPTPAMAAARSSAPGRPGGATDALRTGPAPAPRPPAPIDRPGPGGPAVAVQPLRSLGAPAAPGLGGWRPAGSGPGAPTGIDGAVDRDPAATRPRPSGGSTATGVESGPALPLAAGARPAERQPASAAVVVNRAVDPPAPGPVANTGGSAAPLPAPAPSTVQPEPSSPAGPAPAASPAPEPPVHGGPPGFSPAELDELSRKLYDRLRSRLSAELRLDRERTGSLIEPSF